MKGFLSRDDLAILLYSGANRQGEEATMIAQQGSLRWRLWLPLVCMAAIGIAGSIGSHSLPTGLEWLAHVIRDISIALVVAAVLGATVDIFLKTELSRDVFNAAYAYLLPPELKQEIARIIEYKFICVHHHMILELSPLRGDLYKLCVTSERDIKNVSRESQPIRNIVGVDEWGFEEKSKIDKCSMIFEEREYKGTKKRTDLTEEAIGLETETKSLQYNHVAKLVTEFCEIKTANGEFLINFRSPTVAPIVVVHMPEGMKHTFNFGLPGEEVVKSSITEQYTLKGTHFPGQAMRLRWWPEKTATDSAGT